MHLTKPLYSASSRRSLFFHRSDRFPLIKRAWCRSYQAVFRLAMPILPYRDPMTLDSVATRRLIAKIREMNRAFGIPETLKGIRQEDIPELAAHAEKEANPLYPVPVLMSARDLQQFYYAVMEESK